MIDQLRDKLMSKIEEFDARQPVENAWTPPASWYNDKDFQTLEKEAIFKKNWQYACSSQKLQEPGDFTTGKFMGIPYIVTKDESGNIRAYNNVCSHHGTCVARGEGRTEKFTCPYHGWQYNLEGKLKKAPLAGAIQDVTKKNLGLKEIPTHVTGPFVWLNFGSDSLSTDFDFAAEFTKLEMNNLNLVARKSYTINCNWKVYIDNYLDGGYHVSHMHPGLSAQLDLASYKNECHSGWSVQVCTSTSNSNTDTEYDFNERLRGTARYVWLHPNFVINRYGKWMDTNHVIPIAPDKCEVVFEYYYEGEIDPAMLDRALRASDQVQNEDMDICDMVQTGLSSGVYQKGVYAPQFEKPMYDFHQQLYREFKGE